MQEQRAFPHKEASKSKKRKSSAQMAYGVQTKGESKGAKVVSLPSSKVQKGSERILNYDSPPYPYTERSTPDSLPDASSSDREYRTLRHQYLMKEEESFTLGKELGEVEAEVKALEDEKFALLDQLVVLEGLLDPSEVRSVA